MKDGILSVRNWHGQDSFFVCGRNREEKFDGGEDAEEGDGGMGLGLCFVKTPSKTMPQSIPTSPSSAVS